MERVMTAVQHYFSVVGRCRGVRRSSLIVAVRIYPSALRLRVVPRVCSSRLGSIGRWLDLVMSESVVPDCGSGLIAWPHVWIGSSETTGTHFSIFGRSSLWLSLPEFLLAVAGCVVVRWRWAAIMLIDVDMKCSETLRRRLQTNSHRTYPYRFSFLWCRTSATCMTAVVRNTNTPMIETANTAVFSLQAVCGLTW